MKRIATLFLIFTLALPSLNACTALGLDKVLPDKRTKYRKSRALPNLEVPPDLTLGTAEDAMVIPGEEEANTLSGFQEQQARRAKGDDALSADGWMSLPEDQAALWPKLRQYWLDQDFALDLDDVELGVLETQWMEQEGEPRERHKFTVYAEATPDASGVQVLVSGRSERWEEDGWQTVQDSTYGQEISQQFRQHLATSGRRLAAGAEESGAEQEPLATGAEEDGAEQEPLATGAEEDGAEQEPLATGAEEDGAAQEPPATGAEEDRTAQEPLATGAEENRPAAKQGAALGAALGSDALSTLLSVPARGDAGGGGTDGRTEVYDAGDDRAYLLAPAPFDTAWPRMAEILEQSGFAISKAEEKEGLYWVRRAEGDGKKAPGLTGLGSLTDGDEPSVYVLSMVPIGQGTKILVMDEERRWLAGDEARSILHSIADSWGL